MEDINDGGPAFARPKSRDPENYSYPETYPAQEGMSLRDYFAAKALQGLLTANVEICTDNMPDIDPAAAAGNCYRFADAMLAERSRREAQP
jgi:hypothetical protein